MLRHNNSGQEIYRSYKKFIKVKEVEETGIVFLQ